jgi:hypothetical protein
MKTLRSSRILALLLLASAAIFGANAANQNSGSAQPSEKGTYTVTFHVNTPTTVPDGTTIACKANIGPAPTLFERLMHRQAPAVQSNTGIAQVVNSSANCSVDTPVAFRADRRAAAMSYQIKAYTTNGPIFARTQQNIAIAYPAPGSTAKLPLDVNF